MKFKFSAGERLNKNKNKISLIFNSFFFAFKTEQERRSSYYTTPSLSKSEKKPLLSKAKPTIKTESSSRSGHHSHFTRIHPYSLP